MLAWCSPQAPFCDHFIAWMLWLTENNGGHRVHSLLKRISQIYETMCHSCYCFIYDNMDLR